MATPEQIFADSERIDNFSSELDFAFVVVSESEKLNDYLRERSVRNIRLEVSNMAPGMFMRTRGENATTYDLEITMDQLKLEIENVPADLDAFN